MKLLDSIDVIICVGVDLCEIFQQKMQWLLLSGFFILSCFFLFFSLETVTFLFGLGQFVELLEGG